MKLISGLLWIASLCLLPKQDVITLHFVGDSTMADKVFQPSNPEKGWAQVFRLYLKENIRLRNHAMNGRSTRNFQTEGRWDQVLAELKQGDYVFIQFGHNDAKLDDPNRFADAQTDYRNNLIKFVQDVRKAGGIPVLATPISRRNFDKDGKVIDKHGDYPVVMREVAEKENVLLLDMHHRTMESLEVWGPERSKQLFMHFLPGEYDKFPEGVEDNTHLSPSGAFWICDLVVKEIKSQIPELVPFLRE